MLLTGHEKRTIDLLTPKGVALTLDVLEIMRTPDTVSCAIRKDSGDDPDVTHDTLVFAAVQRTETPGVTIDGGAGVGRVTKRGLDQPRVSCVTSGSSPLTSRSARRPSTPSRAA